MQGWWESVQAAGSPSTLDALDGALITNGYRRTTDWHKRVTASGAVRWFANATVGIEEL